MIFLSNAALDYAYEICKERNSYYVVVACNSSEEKERVWSYLRDKVFADGRDTAVESFSRRYNYSIFCFTNGSFIKIIGTTTSSRANRAHLLLVDKSTPVNVITGVLSRIEFGELYWQSMENMRVDSLRNEIRSDRLRQNSRRIGQ